MAGNATTYLVQTKYLVDDARANRGLNNIAGAARNAERAGSRLKRTLMGVGAGFIAFRAAGAAKRAFVDFNAQVDSLKISLATAASVNLKKPFEDGQRAAAGMFKTFQSMAKSSPGTTVDFVNMANQIGGTVLNSGLGIADLEQITKGGVIASNALAQGRADIMGVDIRQMLSGVVTERDVYAQQLLAGVGYSKGEFNAIDDVKKRADIVKKALTAPQIQDAAKAFGKSFTGQLSTFKDTLQITLGQIGRPMFEAITAELKKWNAWIEKNPAKIREFATSFANALTTGFRAVKSAVGFVVEHKDLLITLAKAALVGKAVGGVASLVGAIGGLSKLGGILGPGKTGVALVDSIKMLNNSIIKLAAGGGLLGKLGAIGKGAGAAAIAGGLGYAIGSWLEGKFDISDKLAGVNTTQTFDTTTPEGKRAAQFSMGWQQMQDAARFSTMTDFQALRAGIADPAASAKLARNTAMMYFGKSLEASSAAKKGEELLAGTRHQALRETLQLADAFGLATKGQRAFARSIRNTNAHLVAFAGTMGMIGFGGAVAAGFERASAKTNINVNINRVEVPAKDPDRWIRDIGEYAARRTRAPTQARNAIAFRGG